jgi:hypothetical protein
MPGSLSAIYGWKNGVGNDIYAAAQEAVSHRDPIRKLVVSMIIYVDVSIYTSVMYVA